MVEGKKQLLKVVLWPLHAILLLSFLGVGLSAGGVGIDHQPGDMIRLHIASLGTS